jgi:hypothetical protein
MRSRLGTHIRATDPANLILSSLLIWLAQRPGRCLAGKRIRKCPEAFQIGFEFVNAVVDDGAVVLPFFLIRLDGFEIVRRHADDAERVVDIVDPFPDSRLKLGNPKKKFICAGRAHDAIYQLISELSSQR